jgi:glycosyltransferase involved in cell wall biosynthesis
MTDEAPLISMVTATYGRSEELRRLIDSLCAQRRGGFELIVVDQNPDDRVADVLAAARSNLPVTHIRIKPEGVSHARNEGAKAAKGDWLIFPDDDCWYPDDFMDNLRALMEKTTGDIYSGRAINISGQTIMGSFPDEPTSITRETIWNTVIEWLTLFRAETFRESGGFDPLIGPGSGSPWGGYEIQDLVLRCLENGATGRYDPAIRGYHPEDRSERSSPENVTKMRRYSQGKGYVMRRH